MNGECDIYYWQRIRDCLCEKSQSMLICFPYVSESGLCCLEDKRVAEKNKILSYSCYPWMAEKRLIVSYERAANPRGHSACIFSF